MKHAPFRYARPDTLIAALSLKAELQENSRYLAGGQSLLSIMSFRLAQPGVLIDLNALKELDYVTRIDCGAIRIGALVRHRQIQTDNHIGEHQPLAREAISQVAHQQIRNRGTLCGNLAHADPASEMPAVLLAQQGRLHVRSMTTDRWINAADFFLGVCETAITGSEMLIEVELPRLPERSGTCFMELSRRQGDYAIVGVAAIVSLNEDDVCTGCRLAFCNMSSTCVLAVEAQTSVIGRLLNQTTIHAAAQIAQEELHPFADSVASAEYKRHLAAVLTRRALTVAAQRAQNQAALSIQ